MSEKKKSDKLPNVALAALLGLSMNEPSGVNDKDVIPPGFECTACHSVETHHVEGCTPPRGYKKIQAAPPKGGR